MNNRNNIAPTRERKVQKIKCGDCNGCGYQYPEDSTRICSMCGGTGILTASSPRISNVEGDRLWRQKMREIVKSLGEPDDWRMYDSDDVLDAIADRRERDVKVSMAFKALMESA